MIANRFGFGLSLVFIVCAHNSSSEGEFAVCDEVVQGASLLQRPLPARKTLRSAGSCDSLAGNACAATVGCGFSGGRCGPRIAWFHVMKTGSSFGTTLAHFANVSLPPSAHIPSGFNASDPEDTRSGGGTLVENFFTVKYPWSVWFEDVFWHPDDPGKHEPVSAELYELWKGNFFGMFRKPARRTLSTWNWFGESDRNLTRYALGVQGQQASMLSLGEKARPRLGFEFGNVAESDHAEVPNVTLAIERLDGFAFVGLTEEFDLSVCLFHHMFGGECIDVEFFNMRKGRYESEVETQQFETDLAQLEALGDPWDTPLYEAASQRFWKDVREHNVNRITCHSTCPGAPAFQDDA